MFKALFYKEWIKTRWYFLISMLVTLGFTAFKMIQISRAMTLKGGPGHFWETMLMKDVIFIDSLQYIPLAIGIVWAIVQFVPEMNHKCLKLTLHLPCNQLKLLYSMLLSGFLLLLFCYVLNLALIYAYFSLYFAPELVSHIMWSAYPWYIAGMAAYLLFAWICLEPTWKLRIFNMIVSGFLLKIFYISNQPEAYRPFILTLIISTLLLFSLPWLSIVRFKEGKQD